MKILEVLEDRVKELISMSVELSKKNNFLEKTVETLKLENELFKVENAKLAENNAQLSTQVNALDAALEKENRQTHNLSEEKSLAKLVVDDLIKSIDALIERENTQ
jgi:hypothetical protein